MKIRSGNAFTLVASVIVLVVGQASCQGTGVTGGLGSVRVQVEGLVTVGGIPAAGTNVALSVPEANCADTREASTITDPEVVLTGADGRYSASLISRGLAPTNYCVVARANGSRVEKASVPFTALEAGTTDTTQLDIATP